MKKIKRNLSFLIILTVIFNFMPPIKANAADVTANFRWEVSGVDFGGDSFLSNTITQNIRDKIAEALLSDDNYKSYSDFYCLASGEVEVETNIINEYLMVSDAGIADKNLTVPIQLSSEAISDLEPGEYTTELTVTVDPEIDITMTDDNPNDDVLPTQLTDLYSTITSDELNISISVTIVIKGAEEEPEEEPEEKKDGTGSVTVSDIFFGESVNCVISSSTNGTSKAVIYYKVDGASDSTYSMTVPTEVGKYNVKVIFPETDEYKEAEATATFTIKPLPTPTYTISGTKGNGDWYKSDVVVTPQSGYKIGTSKVSFSDTLSYSASSQATTIYFQNTATGAVTDGVSLQAFNIDKLAPAISNVQNNQTIYGDSVDVAVMDVNLSSVELDGTTVNFTGTGVTISLDSTDEDTEYVIEATDKAGNKTTIKFTLCAAWKESGIVPIGRAVTLEPGICYKLPDGNDYIIQGEDSVYVGGSSFYIGTEKTVTFVVAN